MKRALVLVDVINGFLHPDGVNYYPVYDETLTRIKEVLELARERGLMIVHVRENHPPQLASDYEFEKLPRHNLNGSWEIGWAPGIEVWSGEYIIEKRRFSAFFETGLNLLLKESGIEQIIIVGVKTHVCIRATAQDAFGWGYRPMLVLEAVGSNYTHLHEASLEDIRRYMGTIVTLDELRELLMNEEGEAL